MTEIFGLKIKSKNKLLLLSSAIFVSLMVVVGYILNISGVVDISEKIDIIRHPVIIEPQKILVSEAIDNNKTICYLKNRSNKIQKEIAVSIAIPYCLTSTNISAVVEVEPDKFRAVRIGLSGEYTQEALNVAFPTYVLPDDAIKINAVFSIYGTDKYMGSSGSYVEGDSVTLLKVETLKHGTYFFTSYQDLAPLESQRISISISKPYGNYQWNSECFISLEVHPIGENKEAPQYR